jgi:hypothetical protein
VQSIAREGLVAILLCKIAGPRWAAQGIAAESPQEAHGRFRGLEAKSPVSGALRQKCALLTEKNKCGNHAL